MTGVSRHLRRTCEICTRAVAGHIVARATGGQWTDENMTTLCYPCNVSDGVNKIPIQTHAF